MTQNTQTIVVLGGTGTTGRRVVDRLSGHDVRVGSRSGTPPFEWTDPDTWAPVLSGVDAVYVAYHPDLAVPGAAETVGALTETARAEGVGRLVLLAGRGEDGAVRAEQAVLDAAGPVAVTIVRASWFAQNFSEGYLLEPVLSGEVALPAAPVGEPFVDVEDIADVAVAALTEDGHAGQVYDVTGPRLLTFAEAVAEIAAAAQRSVGFARIPMTEFRAGMAQVPDVPGEVVDLLEHLFTEVLDGRNEHVGDGVERALGRKARDFTDFARSAAGAWTG